MKAAPRSGWLTAASALTAVLASACCWLPLAAVLAGLSAAGLSAVLWSARPWLLAGSAVLLGVGFWITYRKRASCVPGSDCASPAPVPQLGQRAALWTATAVLVVAALFPRALGLWPPMPAVAATSSEHIEVRVEGMTCGGCERAVEASLRRVDGVVDVRASADAGRAVVTTAPGTLPPRRALIAAVAAAGYRVPDGPGPAGHWTGTLGEGDDAVDLVADIGTIEGGRWTGEMDAHSLGLENVSLEVTVEGRAVRLVVPITDQVAFTGELSDDGEFLAGRFTQGATDLPFVLARSGEPVFSKELLAMEGPGEDAPVTVLSDDGIELKREFNAAADRTRLLLLLSPT